SDPVTRPLRDERRLVVDVRDRAPVVHRAGKLERVLDVLPRGLEVALVPAAAGAPAEDVGAEQIAGQLRADGELERLVEERDRRRDARQLVTADAEAEEDVGTVDVAERGSLDEPARVLQQAERLADLAGLGQRPGFTRAPPNVELDRPGRGDLTGRLPEHLDRLRVAPRLREGLRAGDRRLDAVANVRRDARRQERRVDAETLCKPCGCLGIRSRLAALDLADVLLGEAVAGKLRLRQPGGQP